MFGRCRRHRDDEALQNAHRTPQHGGIRAQGRTRCGCASPPSARGGPGRRWPGGVSASAAAAAEVAASAATGVERGRTPLRRRCGRAVAARFKFLPARFGHQKKDPPPTTKFWRSNTFSVKVSGGQHRGEDRGWHRCPRNSAFRNECRGRPRIGGTCCRCQ